MPDDLNEQNGNEVEIEQNMTVLVEALACLDRMCAGEDLLTLIVHSDTFLHTICYFFHIFEVLSTFFVSVNVQISEVDINLLVDAARHCPDTIRFVSRILQVDFNKIYYKFYC